MFGNMIKMTLLKLCSIAIKQFVYKNKSAVQQVRSPSMQTSGNREELSLGFLFDFYIYTMQTNLSLELSERYSTSVFCQSFKTCATNSTCLLNLDWKQIVDKYHLLGELFCFYGSTSSNNACGFPRSLSATSKSLLLKLGYHRSQLSCDEAWFSSGFLQMKTTNYLSESAYLTC